MEPYPHPLETILEYLRKINGALLQAAHMVKTLRRYPLLKVDIVSRDEAGDAVCKHRSDVGGGFCPTYKDDDLVKFA